MAERPNLSDCAFGRAPQTREDGCGDMTIGGFSDPEEVIGGNRDFGEADLFRHRRHSPAVLSRIVVLAVAKCHLESVEPKGQVIERTTDRAFRARVTQRRIEPRDWFGGGLKAVARHEVPHITLCRFGHFGLSHAYSTTVIDPIWFPRG